MDRFSWQDYTHEHAALVDSWFDADAIRKTGMDEGFDSFCRYWENESEPERGECFWSKLVSENGRPIAVIAYGYHDGTVTVMEIVVDPVVRSQGKGTAVLREFLKNADVWISHSINVFEAVIFQGDIASQIVFYKTGFVRDDKDKERWRRAADDSGILFRHTSEDLPSLYSTPIRWLEPDERRLFNAHLRLCGQNAVSIKKWNGLIKTEVRYCGVFVDNKMVARACIEKLTDRYWEISDVRVAKDYRDQGYATVICVFAVNEIIKNGRIPTIRTERTNDAMLKVIKKLHFQPFDDESEESFVCKIASIEEMNQKWEYEISNHPGNDNWIVWQTEAINNFQSGKSIPYYGILDGTIICEATVLIRPDVIQNSEGMIDTNTAYLCAFRTVKEYRGKGFFTKLLRFMLNDLKQKGYTKAVLGVEPDDEKNKARYAHWGFTEFIKSATETYPDGTVIDVEYYKKDL